MRARTAASISVGLALSLWSATALADVCNIPSAPHPTIQAAVDDLACTEIVLAAQTFAESVTLTRDLELRGASSTATVIEGRVVVEGGSTQVAIRDLEVNGSAPSVAGCFNEALVAQGGARVSATDVVVINGDGEACVLFRDGFESGNTSAWSAAVP